MTYLDTTFAHNDYFRFPTREQSITALLHALKIVKSPVSMKVGMLGNECIWRAISQYYGRQLKVPESVYNTYNSFSDIYSDGTDATHSLISCLSTDNTGLHGVRTPGTVKILPTTMYWGIGRLPQDTNDIFDYMKIAEGEIRVLYSMHSSLSELIDMVKHFNPVQVIPCVSGKFSSIADISAHFANYLRVAKIRRPCLNAGMKAIYSKKHSFIEEVKSDSRKKKKACSETEETRLVLLPVMQSIADCKEWCTSPKKMG